jgi:hypothetical protein
VANAATRPTNPRRVIIIGLPSNTILFSSPARQAQFPQRHGESIHRNWVLLLSVAVVVAVTSAGKA